MGHRIWQPGDKGTCQTCDAEYTMSHHSQRYCSDDHNPANLNREEIRALIREYGPRIHFYK